MTRKKREIRRPPQAMTGDLKGDVAALQIVCWEDAQIEIHPKRLNVHRTIRLSLPGILMEAFRRKDEHWRGGVSEPVTASMPRLQSRPPPMLEQPLEQPPPLLGTKENDNMGTKEKEKLQELANLEGFSGAGVFTPAGEELALLPGSVANIKEVGVLANNVLMNAQKAAIEMGAGRGQVVHIEGDRAHILVRCLNEGTDPLKSQPGRAHLHVVLVLKPDASIGMAKMRLGQVVEKLAEDFR
ncbi:MAG: hypothetical protein WCI05_12505 [Myxococcales bacterium]